MFSNEQLDIDFLPDFNVVDYQMMDPKSPIEQLIGWLITFFIVAAVLVTGWLVLGIPNDIILYITGAFAAVIVWVVYYIFASHKQRGIALREQDILYRRGLIWRTTTIIPFNRIQHIETQRGIFERKLGLATIKIFSAGGLSSDLVIHGLSVYRASQIRQLILEKANSEAFNND
ncbi:PH domain-containing protein [Psychrosphaera aestuarii]|uniref:PH domain-containing protein n=1 Tax=Psychrosphaera aestuarii TaxID=1266052 RepID=UPI001B3240B4|nr:PH domain-containing protein [Psychrosphaera aestuarii]